MDRCQRETLRWLNLRIERRQLPTLDHLPKGLPDPDRHPVGRVIERMLRFGGTLDTTQPFRCTPGEYRYWLLGSGLVIAKLPDIAEAFTRRYLAGDYPELLP